VSIFDDALVSLILGDYVAAEPTGKINAIGAGFQTTTIQPTGNIGPQCVALLIDVPQKYAGQQYPVSLELRNVDTNSVVPIPGTNPPQATRFQQLVTATRPMVPGIAVPDSVPCRHQMVLQMHDGIPLAAGRYAWRVEIDGKHRPNWHAYFTVLAPPAAPVVGGPTAAAPTDLPTLS
jgi:hypothetical protein